MERILQELAELLLNIYKALVDALDAVLPSTPENIKLGNLVSNALTGDPFWDYYILVIAQTALLILGVVLVYKLIKILPLT